MLGIKIYCNNGFPSVDPGFIYMINKFNKYDKETNIDLSYIDDYYKIREFIIKYPEKNGWAIGEYLKNAKIEKQKLINIYDYINDQYQYMGIDINDARKRLIKRIEKHLTKINKFIKSLYELKHIIRREWNESVNDFLDKKGVCNDVIKSFLY